MALSFPALGMRHSRLFTIPALGGTLVGISGKVLVHGDCIGLRRSSLYCELLQGKGHGEDRNACHWVHNKAGL
jgi:hypothetical protein